MVIYGVAADVSIGELFMGGVIPGVLMGVSLMVMVGVVARREGMGRQPFAGLKAIARTFCGGFFALMTPVVILGGMFNGLFTPTEAAAVACLYALFLGFVVCRTREFKHRQRQLRNHVTRHPAVGRAAAGGAAGDLAVAAVDVVVADGDAGWIGRAASGDE